MRKIVVPTDFSDNAYNALKYACEIFKYERSEICIIHAYADEVYQLGNITERSILDKRKDEVEQKTASALGDLMRRIKEYAPNPKHTYTSIAAFGSLIDEVNELVERENTDIVVMGTRGASNDRSNTFGSNTLQCHEIYTMPRTGHP